MIGLVRQQCKQVTGSLFLAQSQNEIETNQNVFSTSSLGHITDVLNFKCLPATLFYSTFNYTNQSPGFCCCVSFPTNKHKRADRAGRENPCRQFLMGVNMQIMWRGWGGGEEEAFPN